MTLEGDIGKGWRVSTCPRRVLGIILLRCSKEYDMDISPVYNSEIAAMAVPKWVASIHSAQDPPGDTSHTASAPLPIPPFYTPFG